MLEQISEYVGFAMLCMTGFHILFVREWRLDSLRKKVEDLRDEVDELQEELKANVS